MQPWSSLPLYWRVSLINAAVFLGGAIVLVVSRATVSAEVSAAEPGVLAAGLVLTMVLNADLLHRSVPVDQLIALMQRWIWNGRVPDDRAVERIGTPAGEPL